MHFDTRSHGRISFMTGNRNQPITLHDLHALSAQSYDVIRNIIPNTDYNAT